MTVLPDVLLPDLEIVFCGTAASAASARRRAYYAGPGNAFWPTLFKTGLTPRLLKPEEFRCITGFGLGLTDLAKFASGADHSLQKSHFDARGLHQKIIRYRPRILAFTSKRAAQEYLGKPVQYGSQPDQIGDTALFVLPSPSGAARRYWNPDCWQQLARLRTKLHTKSDSGEY